MDSAQLTAPQRQVRTPMDMGKWRASQAYQEYTGFVAAMNTAVAGKAVSSDYPVSTEIEKLVQLLERLDEWVTEIPPIDQPARFGNAAFRTWLTKVQDEIDSLLQEVLPEKLHPNIVEISQYLTDGFGNKTRIDYGSGHEMSFAMFLCCLFKLGFLKPGDSAACILRVFNRYLTLVRRLQTDYRMEPAGSHGAWSLDDFQFLPFVWGSSQLIMHPRLEPKSFAEEEIPEQYSDDYLFMSCIEYINKVKTGPFHEHSHQLFNVSGVSSWEKVNKGLTSMYKDEVLAKFPVIQHVVFGRILSIEPHVA